MSWWGRATNAVSIYENMLIFLMTMMFNYMLIHLPLVVSLQRVRLADGVAMSFDETYLPRDIGEKVADNDLEAEPVFALLEDKYDTPLVEAEYKLEAAAADLVAAQALQVPAGSPIFLIERTSYTTGNRPVDYERLHYRGDLIRFVTRLVRHARASMQR